MKAYKDIVSATYLKIREYEPCKRTIEYFSRQKEAFDENPVLHYAVPLPRMLFMQIKQHENLGVLFALGLYKPLESLDDEVYVMPLGNVYQWGWVCGCDTDEFNEGITKFWNSRFCADGAGISFLRRIFFDSSVLLKKRGFQAHEKWVQETHSSFLEKIKAVPNYMMCEEHRFKCPAKSPFWQLLGDVLRYMEEAHWTGRELNWKGAPPMYNAPREEVVPVLEDNFDFNFNGR
jgi:hypothetical protein